LSVPDEGYHRNVSYLMKFITETCRTWWRLSQKRVVPDEGYPRNVPDEGYHRNVSYLMKVITETCRTWWRLSQKRVVSDDGYPRNVPDEGYHRNIPDEGYHRNVPDEGYHRNVPDEGYHRNVSCSLYLFLRRKRQLVNGLIENQLVENDDPLCCPIPSIISSFTFGNQTISPH